MKRILIFNAINLVILMLIAVLYFLFPPIPVMMAGAVWLIWAIRGNYKMLVTDNDELSVFEDALQGMDRRHRTNFYRHFGVPMLTNHRAILAKEGFFSDQPESIQRAYGLICQKSKKCLESSMSYLKQYDFVRRPDPNHLHKMASLSNSLIMKLQELSEDCFLIEDQASDVDISVVDDILNALDDMHE